MNICDNDTVEMLLFYDKYQFRSGIRLLDYKLAESIRTIIQDAKLSRRQPTATKKLLEVVKALEVVAAFISKDSAIDFPLTKNVLPALALGLFYYEKNIEGSFFFVNPNQELRVRLLLPYVFDATNIDLGPVIPDLVDIAYGATINERTREELKSIVLDDSFLSTLKIKLSQTEQLTNVLSNLKIREIEIDYTTAEIAGRYIRHKRKDYGLGAMNCWYSMPNVVVGTGLDVPVVTFVVQALDGIGSRWTISAHLRSWEIRCGSTTHKSTLLYEWHKGENITSILPPKKGWTDMGAKDFFQREDNAIEDGFRNYSADSVHLSYEIND